ncbi:MAG TPA: YncE family protein [Candidatus Dormibacteraeota bacterium]|nr:YncE family protein [Candidatus Dormibacteraeota bacterium]
MKRANSAPLALATILLAFHSPAADLLKKIADIPLPGGATRFDYASIDPAAGRLYFSHMGDGKLMVFDLRAEKLVTNLPGFPTMTGVLVVPSVHRVYGSVTKNHEVAVVDTESLAVVKRIPDGKFPDGLAFSPETKKLYVSDESGGVDTVIDTSTNEKLRGISLGGEAGNTQYDPTSHLIYVAVQTKNQLVTIDPQADKITARYDLKKGKHPHGFYIDAPRNRAYVSCQGDDKLILFNLASHQEEDVFPVAGGPDVLAFDTELNLLYVACESGAVSLFKADNGKLIKLGDIDVGPNCHTVAVDPKTHKAYFPLKNIDGAPVLRIMVPTQGSH